MKKQKPKLNEILSKVSIFYGVSEYEIKGRRKNKEELVMARHVFCYLSRKMTDKSTTKIGKEIHRDHATVLHSFNKVNDLMDVYSDVKEEVLNIIPNMDLNKRSIVVQDIDLLEMSKLYTKTVLNC